MSHPLCRALRVRPGDDLTFLNEELEELLIQSVKHGLGGVVLERLGSITEARAPSLAAIRASVMASVSSTMKVKRLFLRVNAALRARGIEPVLLKGIGLGDRFYGDALRRPTSDVDLLVSPHQLGPAREVLRSLGLRPKQDSDDYYPPAHRHHEAFESPDGLVELHFRLMANWGSRWEADGVLARAIDATLGGVAVRYLCPEHEFVYLALHAANHMLSRLGWLYDLKLVVRATPTLDWDAVIDTAKATRMPSPAFFAFDAANRLVDASIPERVLGALSPLRAAVLASRLVFSEQSLMEGRLVRHRAAWAAAKVLLADSPSQVMLFALRRLWWNAQRARHAV